MLNGVIERKASVAEAARLMAVSERHAWRLPAACRREGTASVTHGNRGRKPSTATSPGLREKAPALALGPYADGGRGASPGEPVVLRDRKGRRSNGRLPAGKPGLASNGHHDPRTPLKAKPRIPTKPSPNHPWRRPRHSH